MIDHAYVVRRLKDISATAVHVLRGPDPASTYVFTLDEFATVLLAEEQIIDDARDLYADRHRERVNPDTPMQRADHEVEDAPRKPSCPLVGTDGNVFAIIGTVKRCLERDGQPERAQAWVEDATSSGSYDEVLQKAFRYTDPM